MIQEPMPPVPPGPPPGPPFDLNLFLQTDGGPPIIVFIVFFALAATVIILWPIMRAFGRRLEGRGTADQALRADLEQLHARLGEMDALHARVLELEERVDFTERLLAQSHDPQKSLIRGKDR
jgi:Tfp pilus assembly protein PilO